MIVIYYAMMIRRGESKKILSAIEYRNR